MNNTIKNVDEIPCFFCRFNLGFTMNDLDPGLMGFLIILSSFICFLLCIALAICFCCCKHNNKQYDYAEVPSYFFLLQSIFDLLFNTHIS